MYDDHLVFRLPDGTDVTCLLDQLSITIGSDPANDVVLDDPSVGPHHALVIVETGRVSLIDQAAPGGTRVNEEQLQPSVGQPIEPGDALLIGRVQGRFVAGSGAEPSAAPVETGPLRLALAESPAPVEPGWVSHATIAVEHHGTTEETYRIAVTGVPEEWVKLSQSQVQLDPSGIATARVTFAVPREASGAAGQMPFTITARALSDPLIAADVGGTLEVLGIDSLALAVLPEKGHGPFRVVLHNQGSSTRSYRLAADDMQEALDYSLAPASVDLLPAQQTECELTVTPRIKRTFGTSHTHRFQVTATPGTPGIAPTKTLGEIVVPPRVRLAWIILAALAAFLLITAYGQLCRYGNLPGCAVPDITFTVQPSQLKSGDEATLAWSVDGAQSVVIEPQPGSVEHEGTYAVVAVESTTYTLRATGDNGRSSEQAVSVSVLDLAPVVERFDANPATFVRGQVDEIELSWAAPGADKVTITGLEGVFLASGSTTTTAPDQTRNYTLIAANSAGSTYEEAEVVVEEAGCVVASASSDPVPLREGPGVEHRTIAMLDPGTAVEPVGRSSDGNWAFVAAGNRDGWLEREHISCEVQGAEFPTVDPSTIPTAPPTSTAEPTETPLPTQTAVPTGTDSPTQTPTQTATSTATGTATPEPTATRRGILP